MAKARVRGERVGAGAGGLDRRQRGRARAGRRRCARRRRRAASAAGGARRRRRSPRRPSVKPTASALAKTTAAKAPSAASARSSGCQLAGGAARTSGISTTSAPRARRAAAMSERPGRARPTTTRRPCSGRVSIHDTRSRSATTSPTKTSAGARGRCRVCGGGDARRQIGDRAGDDALARPSSPRRRRPPASSRARPPSTTRAQVVGEPLARHEEHERPVGHRGREPLVPGGERDRRGDLAMRERNAGVGGGAERRGDAGHDLEGDAGLARAPRPPRRRVRRRADRRP